MKCQTCNVETIIDQRHEQDGLWWERRVCPECSTTEEFSNCLPKGKGAHPFSINPNGLTKYLDIINSEKLGLI